MNKETTNSQYNKNLKNTYERWVVDKNPVDWCKELKKNSNGGTCEVWIPHKDDKQGDITNDVIQTVFET